MTFRSSAVYRFLDQKNIHWIIILIATAAKSVFTTVFSSYEGDKSFYLLLAENLGNGKGFTIPVALVNQPEVAYDLYLPSAISPLYSIIAVPFLKLFPGNYLLVSTIIESLSWLLLFIVIRKLLKLVVSENGWSNAFILLSGFFIYNVELSASSKDVLATALIFLAFYQCLKIYSSSAKVSLIKLILASFLFILPGLTKYMYLPLALVFPLALIILFVLNRNKQLLKAGFIGLAVSTLLMFLHYQYFYSIDLRSAADNSTFYLNRWSLSKGDNDFVSGFYPENLLLLYPYMPASLINLDVIGVWIRSYIPAFYKLYGLALSILNFIGVISFAISFAYIIKKYFRKNIPVRIAFFIIGTIISFSMVAAVCVFSLRYHTIQYKGGSSAWTYVFENRPFIFSILFIQLLLLVFVFSKTNQSAFFKRIKLFLLLIICIGILHGLYFIVKTAVSPSSVLEKNLSVNRLVMRDAKTIALAHPSHALWIVTEMQHLDWYAKLHKQKVLNYVSYLNDSSFNLPPKTIMLTVLAKEDTAKLHNYTLKQHIDSSWSYNDTWFVYLQKN